MRVVDDRTKVDEDQIIALVITGDGKTEFRRLKPLAPRFEGDEVLWFPQRPERYLSTVGRRRTPTTAEKAGLDTLEALELYKSKYGITSYLFLIDGEHVDGTAAKELRTKLRDVSTDEEFRVSQIEEGAFRCSCRVGSRHLSVYTVIFGYEFGFIEDCLAKLLQLEWGNSIEATDKQEFKTKVNKVVAGGVYQDLVGEAKMDNVRRAFPNLSSVLDEMRS